MGSPKIRKLVESFRIPLREYSDWADYSAQPLPDGTGFRMTFHNRPPEATDLDVTGGGKGKLGRVKGDEGRRRGEERTVFIEIKNFWSEWSA
jgi:hypothetical protein